MSNQYLTELVQRLEDRYAVESTDMSLGEWLCANTTLQGRPFSFDRYPFQRAIADDMHPNMDVIKPSQVGLSEIQVRKSAAFLARNRGTTLIFTMPNEKMYERMSKTRIRPLIEGEKVFNLISGSEEKPIRSMGLYQIGTSFMFVTGATEGDATSISADAVFNDEVDLTNQQMLSLFNSRLQNSDWKLNQRFSTPTHTNYGVDKGFQVSDQHEYMCKCDTCNHWNIPVFRPQFVHIPGLSGDISDLTHIDEGMIDSGKIDLENSYVKCEKCNSPLDLSRTDNREWVPRFALRDHHRGYRVSPFSTDRLPVKYVVQQLLRYKSRDYLRGWYNTVLGEAFTDGNARLSDADIQACFTGHSTIPNLDPRLPTWIGADIGQTCHVVVAQGYSVRDLHCVRMLELPIGKLIEFMQEMIEVYNVVGGACDRFPYTPTADELYEVSNGLILPVEYRGQKSLNLVKDQVTQEVTHAQVNRTQILDDVAKGVRRRNLRFSGYGNQQSIIVDHLRDMIRDESPETEAKWIKMTNNDHYFHALAFLIAGVKLKEAYTELYTSPRSSLPLIGGIATGAAQTSLIGGKVRKQPGII